jgi:hypothetical protein
MLDTLALKQTVAISVLDKPGEVKEIKLRSGRQAFVERLQQLVTPAVVAPGRPAAGRDSAAEQTRKLPADPALAFTRLASERINGALVRCEERYPNTGSHSTLVVVVEREPAQWRETLKSLHAEVFAPGKTDPLAPVQLEVIDRATDEAIQRLVAAGLISLTSRAVRPLFPESDSTGSSPLSAEEQARIKSHREHAARKFKLARLLGESGFAEEARPALLEAIQGIACALAVERRVTEPREVAEILQPPLANFWPNALADFQRFLQEPATDPKPVIAFLESMQK